MDPGIFQAVLEGEVPDGSGRRLGRRMGGEIHHRPGRDLTFSAPKSVSLAALIGGDGRIVEAHGRAAGRALGWFEKNAAETRVQDPATGRMVRAGDQKTVIATFRHETSRNLDPALHTHSVIANMLLGNDGKWRTMANESLYASKMLLGALYRSELAGELMRLGYGIERTHADGRFEIAGVPRHIIDAFSTRRAEIEAAMESRGLGATADNQHLARRAAARQADLFDFAARAGPAGEAVGWAFAHLSERDAVFSKTDLLAGALAYNPGAASIEAIERATGKPASRASIPPDLSACQGIEAIFFVLGNCLGKVW